MTVLICIPCLQTGGTEIQTLNLVRALVQGGHRVVTACYFEHAPQMVERYRAAGSEVELFEPEGRRVGGWRGVLFLYRHLRRCVKKYRPQVAHVQYMAPGAQPVALLKLLGVPRILATAHTDAQIYRSLRLLHGLQRHVVDVFTCITCRAEEEFFGSSCLYSEETVLQGHDHVTIHNALPPHIQLADEAAVLRVLPAEPVVGVVSRLEHIKGMDVVIPAFARLLELVPQARLLVVGDGSLRPQMEQQAQELGVAERIEWAGRQGQEELQASYDRLSLFWMPSRSEGFGLSALEAMARGCPVVASAVGGLPELMGSCGALVPADSAEALAAASAGLLHDAAEWQRQRALALARAAEFAPQRYAELMLNLYGKVVPCSF